MARLKLWALTLKTTAAAQWQRINNLWSTYEYIRSSHGKLGGSLDFWGNFGKPKKGATNNCVPLFPPPPLQEPSQTNHRTMGGGWGVRGTTLNQPNPTLNLSKLKNHGLNRASKSVAVLTAAWRGVRTACAVTRAAAVRHKCARTV